MQIQKEIGLRASSLSCCPYTRTILVFYAFYAFYAWRLGFHFPQSVCSGFLRQESDNQPKFQCKEYPVATVTVPGLAQSFFFLHRGHKPA
jgi:hypothetical protein